MLCTVWIYNLLRLDLISWQICTLIVTKSRVYPPLFCSNYFQKESILFEKSIPFSWIPALYLRKESTLLSRPAKRSTRYYGNLSPNYFDLIWVDLIFAPSDCIGLFWVLLVGRIFISTDCIGQIGADGVASSVIDFFDVFCPSLQKENFLNWLYRFIQIYPLMQFIMKI